MQVGAGDVYFVSPYQMHALYNDSNDEQLIFLNIAPKGHNENDSFDV